MDFFSGAFFVSVLRPALRRAEGKTRTAPLSHPLLFATCGSTRRQQRRRDLPFFLNEDVVRTAGRAQIHHLKSDLARGKGLPDRAARKDLLRPGAEQHDIGPQRKDLLQIPDGEGGCAARLPVEYQLLRRHDARGPLYQFVDMHLACGVTTDEIDVSA